jgi:hypothetical protein
MFPKWSKAKSRSAEITWRSSPGCLEVPEESLQTLWVADKLYAIAKDEEVALQAMEVVQDELKYHYSTKK